MAELELDQSGRNPFLHSSIEHPTRTEGVKADVFSTEQQVEAATGSPSVATAPSAGWMVAARVLSQVAQFLIVLIAVRFLNPAEAGTFALISALAIGLTQLGEAGRREYVMVSNDPKAIPQTNALALLTGAACCLVGLLIALGTNLHLGSGISPDSTSSAMMLMSVWVLLTTVQTGLLVKRGGLKQIAFVQILAEFTGFAVAATLIVSGEGLFGLVFGKLLGQSVAMAASVLFSRWFHLIWPPADLLGKSIPFPARITATRLISFANDNLPLLLIGAVVGPASAGFFRAASRLGGAVGDVINEPIRLLIWSNIHVEGARQKIERRLTASIFVCLPLFVGIALTADQFVDLLFGHEWSEVAPLLTHFAAYNAFSLLNLAVEPLLASKGKVAVLPYFSFS